ncbi:MAG TPA: hypothetical protein VLL56_00120 [Terriglobia bacterium]|nr:hypothetical protein [Terriglobia bacterium]
MERRLIIAASVVCLAVCSLNAQQRGQAGQRGPAPTPRAGAPIDLTGYWVSVVTEDWEFRMVTAPKGEFGGLGSIPINDEGRRVASTWDPARDEAAGEQCRSYGAAAIMRVPGRLHVTWQDDNTLRIDTDAGTQTRLLHFGAAKPDEGPATWQGYSVAQWEGAGRGATRGGSLKVVTTHMRPGYLRKNGAPYSANALLSEYYDRYQGPNGDEWLVVTTIVEDPQYLSQSFTTSTNFKKLPDATGWNPTPCSAK